MAEDVRRIIDETVRVLSGLPGIVGAKEVGRSLLDHLVEVENRYEQEALVPTRCLGVRIAAAKDAAVAVLKDAGFRKPSGPTVYMAEEDTGGGGPPEHYLNLEGARYRIVGEEVLASHPPYGEKTVPMGDSFVFFPDRLRSSRVPSFFLIPPLGFPELETAADRLGIRGVISVSPSPRADGSLRDFCGFSSDPSMATLLLAFDYSLKASP